MTGESEELETQLSSIRAQLRLRSDGETSIGSMHAALSQLSVSEARARLRVAHLRRALSAVGRRTAAIVKLKAGSDASGVLIMDPRVSDGSGGLGALDHSQGQDAVVERDKAAELTANTRVLALKGTEYVERKRTLEERREAIAGGKNRVEINDVLQLRYAVAEKIRVLEEKKDRLSGYQDLPPDMHLAQLKLAEKKMQLASLIKKKDSLLQSIMNAE
ncbi:hypothetical protein BC830DRAFT_1112918 [Chytriomyces sp. MP71]|nr:hypothetical protein BC830DRAFT_1112918 [Chytriomyces sp. MP71]